VFIRYCGHGVVSSPTVPQYSAQHHLTSRSSAGYSTVHHTVLCPSSYIHSLSCTSSWRWIILWLSCPVLSCAALPCPSWLNSYEQSHSSTRLYATPLPSARILPYHVSSDFGEARLHEWNEMYCWLKCAVLLMSWIHTVQRVEHSTALYWAGYINTYFKCGISCHCSVYLFSPLLHRTDTGTGIWKQAYDTIY
jgi:hypothetical protein